MQLTELAVAPAQFVFAPLEMRPALLEPNPLAEPIRTSSLPAPVKTLVVKPVDWISTLSLPAPVLRFVTVPKPVPLVLPTANVLPPSPRLMFSVSTPL